MDLGDRMANAKDLSTLAAPADKVAAVIAEGVALRRPPGVFPAGSGISAGSLSHLDPSASQGSQW